MVVDADVTVAMPWLEPVVTQAMAMPHAHALLLHGKTGSGAFECARDIATAWLCEAAPDATRPCRQCAACRLVGAGLHPDLHLLLPEELRVALGWQGQDADTDGGDKSKRKPSRQIRIDEVRAAIDWVVTTSSRGRAKVILIHPAEAMNVQSANALLKTLEEPPRGARLLLCSAEPEALLPTVRSRCQRLRLHDPDPQQARQWLAAKGLSEPEVLLAACAGRPLDALAMAAAGIDAARWSALPAALFRGSAETLRGWPPSRALDALQKLCHDGLALWAGAPPRFFASSNLPKPRSIAAMARWSRELSRLALRVDHPWNEALLLDALAVQTRAAWTDGADRSDTLAA